MDSSKLCSKCREQLPLFMFDFHSWKKGDSNFGLSSWCKPCRNLQIKIRRNANMEKHRENNKRWADNRKDKRREYDKARRSSKEYAVKNKSYCHNYRSRKTNAKGTLTIRAIELMYLIHGRYCLKCGSGDELQIDHVVPLTKGGSNYIYNLQPLCISCNSSKGNRRIEDFRMWA